MSENTPDSAMDASDMGSEVDGLEQDSADNEPSMEDILASIRQIIADDQTENSDDELDQVQNEELAVVEKAEEPIQEQSHVIDDAVIEELVEVQNTEENIIDTAEQPDINDEADILELINFVDTNTQDAPVERDLDISNQENSNDQGGAFNESLDLVMDADASDYLTTIIAPATKLSTAPETAMGLHIDSDDLAIPEIPESNPIADLENAQTINTSDDEDMDLVKSLLSDLMDESQSESNVEIEAKEEFIDLAGEMDALFDDADIDDASPEAILQKDTEIDFVTGLVIDNADIDAVFDDDMEIPSPDEMPQSVEATQEEAAKVEIVTPEIQRPTRQERDFITGNMIEVEITDTEPGDEAQNILEEILHKSIADEVAVHEEFSEKNVTAQSEIVEPTEPVEAPSENVVLSELSEKPAESPIEEIEEEQPAPRHHTKKQSSEILGVDQNIQTVTVHEEDTVSLPKSDVSRKFSLLANTTRGVSALGLGAAAALMKDNKNDDAGKTSAQSIAEDTERSPKIEQDLPLPSKETEKDKAMAQAAKIETILDTETVESSASAFASLNTAVQEKAKMEESGPAIGDLVQEALKPMLKEWLDKNLKGIVERAVTKEVKRISSGK